MDLSIFDLKNIKKHCEELTQTISLILKEKYPEKTDKPFNNLSDYEKSIENQLLQPELYYKVQIFNRMTYITYRKNTQMYHIVVKGFYTDKLNKYKRYSNTDDSYVISNDFNKTLSTWYDVIIDCISILRPQQEFNFELF